MLSSQFLYCSYVDHKFNVYILGSVSSFGCTLVVFVSDGGLSLGAHGSKPSATTLGLLGIRWTPGLVNSWSLVASDTGRFVPWQLSDIIHNQGWMEYGSLVMWYENNEQVLWCNWLEKGDESMNSVVRLHFTRRHLQCKYVVCVCIKSHQVQFFLTKIYFT